MLPVGLIRLIGPAGAGKTTVGLALANRLRLPFVDLDQQFTLRFGDISDYLAAYGYATYARHNVQVYLDTLQLSSEDAVFALSSGFMTYGGEIHPDYLAVCQEIVASPTTVALFPSFDYETCVNETVRRQLLRPFSRSPEREEQVIRSRFDLYWKLPTKKCETMKAVDAVVEAMLTPPPRPPDDIRCSSARPNLREGDDDGATIRWILADLGYCRNCGIEQLRPSFNPTDSCRKHDQGGSVQAKV
jgi:shikimate kinase